MTLWSIVVRAALFRARRAGECPRALRMAVGYSDELEPGDAVEDVLRQCADTLAELEPSAGLLFSTHESDPAPVIAAVRNTYPAIDLVGSTSAAELSSVLGFQEGSVILAFFASDAVDIRGGLGTDASSDPEGAARAALREALGKAGREPRLCLTAPAPHQEPLRLLESLRAELGEDVPVPGGVSSSTFDDPGAAYQFCNDRVVHDSTRRPSRTASTSRSSSRRRCGSLSTSGREASRAQGQGRDADVPAGREGALGVVTQRGHEANASVPSPCRYAKGQFRAE